MLKKIGFVVMALGVALGSVSIANAGNPLGACKACHFFDKGADVKKSNLGPGLQGVMGRKISIDTSKFVEYTDKAGNVQKIEGDTWTEANMNVWLMNPKKVKPGTKMTFKQKKEKKRQAIIDALKAI